MPRHDGLLSDAVAAVAVKHACCSVIAYILDINNYEALWVHLNCLLRCVCVCVV